MFVCPVRKISQVIMKWRRRASHLGRFTLWNNGRQATKVDRFNLLSGTTSAELHNSVNLLCGITAAEPNNPVWYIQQESHTFFKDSDEPCWKMWVEGLIQSKINDKLLKDERFGRFSKHRTIGDLQQTIAMCTLYKDWANVWKMSAEDTRITKWVSASKWGKM